MVWSYHRYQLCLRHPDDFESEHEEYQKIQASISMQEGRGKFSANGGLLMKGIPVAVATYMAAGTSPNVGAIVKSS